MAKKELNKRVTNTGLTWADFSLTGLAIISVFIGILTFLFFENEVNHYYPQDNFSLDQSAKIGSYISGMVGSWWSLSGVVLLFLALNLQRKELEAQRKQLQQQQKEFTVK